MDIPEIDWVKMTGGFIFSSIGFVAFVYGKKMHQLKTLGLGICLMAYPVFVTDTLAVYLAGAALTAALFYLRD